jgi:hypothetical protein
MNIDIEPDATEPYPEHGPGRAVLGRRCWPLPSDSDEALLSRRAVDAGAAGDASPTETGGPGHGVAHRGVDRPVRTVIPPSLTEPMDDPAGVPMPAFDERSAASLACVHTTGHRHRYGPLTAATEHPGVPAGLATA